MRSVRHFRCSDFDYNKVENSEFINVLVLILPSRIANKTALDSLLVDSTSLATNLTACGMQPDRSPPRREVTGQAVKVKFQLIVQGLKKAKGDYCSVLFASLYTRFSFLMGDLNSEMTARFQSQHSRLVFTSFISLKPEQSSS